MRKHILSFVLLLHVLLPSMFSQQSAMPSIKPLSVNIIDKRPEKVYPDFPEIIRLPNPFDAAEALKQAAMELEIPMDAVPHTMDDVSHGIYFLYSQKSFVPEPGIGPQLSEVIKGPHKIENLANDNGEIVCILQMSRKISLAEIIMLLQTNTRVLDEEAGEMSFIIKTHVDNMEKIADFPFVRGIHYYKPEYKYRFLENPRPGNHAKIYVFDGDKPEYRQVLEGYGVNIKLFDSTLQSYDVDLPKYLFDDLARRYWWIRGIAEYAREESHNAFDPSEMVQSSLGDDIGEPRNARSEPFELTVNVVPEGVARVLYRVNYSHGGGWTEWAEHTGHSMIDENAYTIQLKTELIPGNRHLCSGKVIYRSAGLHESDMVTCFDDTYTFYSFWTHNLDIDEFLEVDFYFQEYNFTPQDSRQLIMAFDAPYTGNGVNVGVYDTGIWWSDPDHSILDFPIGSVFSNGGYQDDTGHGTHVSGIIAARGARELHNEHNAKGVAPGATLYVSSGVTGSGGVYTYKQAYNFFKEYARVSNHSWGDVFKDDEGNEFPIMEYNDTSRDFDTWAGSDNHVFVAGVGNDGEKPGYTSPMAPSNAKNVLSVGSISYVTPDAGGASIGKRVPRSSFGPTAFGTLKPDLVAPGGYGRSYGVVSNNAPTNNGDINDGVFTHPEWLEDDYYIRSAGTSMAAPHVTGAIAQLIEAFPHYSSNRLKAIVINNAIPLKENNRNLPHGGYASTNVGYGLINNYSNILKTEGEAVSLLKIDGTLNSSGSPLPSFNLHNIYVTEGAKQLKATLAYNDRPGVKSTNQAQPLKNRLDLTLISPSGEHFSYMLPDNVEHKTTIQKIVYENPSAGTWRVKVEFSSTYGIMNQQQSYSVVADLILKEPALDLSVNTNEIHVIPGELFEIVPTVVNTGGYIAAGVHVRIHEGNHDSSVNVFGEDANRTFYMGNLLHEGDFASRPIRLSAPHEPGAYLLITEVDGINMEFTAPDYPKKEHIFVIVEEDDDEQPEECASLKLEITGGNSVIPFCQWASPSTTLTANASGGTPPYSYSWEGGSLTVNTSGSYTCTVIDALGCVRKTSVYVLFIPVICPVDPNDITGPAGYGDEQWVSVNETMNYLVRFENDPDFATAPAQVVRISVPIHENMNMYDFRLGSFGFGSYDFDVPPNKSIHTERLDVRESLGLYVDITAGLNVITQEAFWLFESIDPDTGLPPQDAMAGFLPINDELASGEGYVYFTIKPKSTCNTGDIITAQASIVFDDEAPIETNIWVNTVDAVPPSSSINEVAEVEVNTYHVFFSGQDDPGGSGIESYQLYVSYDGISYELYGDADAGSHVVYTSTGVAANPHLISRARDFAGNLEPMKSEPDIVLTTIVAYAGEDALICENESYYLADAFTNASFFYWTGGDGIFDNAYSIHPLYTPGNNDKLNEQVVLCLRTITTPEIVGCMTLTIHQLPEVFCSSDLTLPACTEIATIDSLFNAWITGFYYEGGTGITATDLSVYEVPDYCGGELHIIYEVEAECGYVSVCSATFTIEPATLLTVEGPEDVYLESCMSQYEVNTLFNEWKNVFSFEGGCGTTETNLQDYYPPDKCGGTVMIIYEAEEACGQDDIVIATFEVEYAPFLWVSCPSSVTLPACTPQSEIDDEFYSWIGQFEFDGGCNTYATELLSYVPPSECGGTILIHYFAGDDCQQIDVCISSFKVIPAPSLSINCPPEVEMPACKNQLVVDAAFDAWMEGFTHTGDCYVEGYYYYEYYDSDNQFVENGYGYPPSPEACGGQVIVYYDIWGYCNPELYCSSSFSVIPAPEVIALCPTSINIAGCGDQEYINSAYADWLNEFSFEGGCNTDDWMIAYFYDYQTNTWSDYENINVPPDACGGRIQISYYPYDDCDQEDYCWTSFNVLPPQTLIAVCPPDMQINSADNQEEIDMLFANWINEFGFSGGCNPTATSLDNFSAPDIEGGEVVVSFMVTDECGQESTCTSTFTILPLPILEVYPESLDFENVIVNQCKVLAYDLYGTNFVESVVITTQGDFLVSVESDQGFADQIEIIPEDNFIYKTIFVQFCPQSTQTHTAEILHSSAHMAPVVVSLVGDGLCSPPQNLSAHITDQNHVLLSWDAPQIEPFGSFLANKTLQQGFSNNHEKDSASVPEIFNFGKSKPNPNLFLSISDTHDGEIDYQFYEADRSQITLNYDGPYAIGLGMTSPGTIYAAVRFPADMLNDYIGYKLDDVDIAIRDAPSSLKLMVWGEGAESSPGELIHEQVHLPTALSWNTINLDTDIILSGSDLWVGYKVTLPGAMYPCGVDAGPAVLNGDWLSSNGQDWIRLINNPTPIDRNWNIRAKISPGEHLPLGYNIYRNDELIEHVNYANKTFIDGPLDAGTYNYFVTSVYENCESLPTNQVEVIVTEESQPDNFQLLNHTVFSGEEACFDALQTITVSDFTVEAGGSATLIAGESIYLLPGTLVEHGGYLLARIAAHEDDYCGIPRAIEIAKEPVASKEEDVVSVDFNFEIRENGFFKLYPNPTDGTFTLELTTAELEQTITVEVHSILGGRLFTKELPAQRLHTLSLEGQQPGMYIIWVMIGDKVGVERLIKR